jgi:streptogramin lyase
LPKHDDAPKVATEGPFSLANFSQLATTCLCRNANRGSAGPLRGARGLAFVGGKLWFAAETNQVIGSYDPATKRVDWVLGTGQNRTHMIFVSPDLKRMITSDVSSATMSIDKITRQGPMGSQDDWDQTVLPVGRGAEGFEVTPDGKQIWAANAQDGTISVLDAAKKKSSTR